MKIAQKKPPTFYPLRSKAAQNQLRQCECCWKAQKISEGFDVKAGLCRQCADGFSEQLAPLGLIPPNIGRLDDNSSEECIVTTESGSVLYHWRPGLWARFKNWLKGIA